YTGLELPIDNQPFNVSLIFHAKTAVARVAITGSGINTVRTSTDGAAVSRFWAFQFVNDMSANLPVQTLPTNPLPQRHIGLYVPHPAYFYMHYGTPIRTLD